MCSSVGAERDVAAVVEHAARGDEQVGPLLGEQGVGAGMDLARGRGRAARRRSGATTPSASQLGRGQPGARAQRPQGRPRRGARRRRARPAAPARRWCATAAGGGSTCTLVPSGSAQPPASAGASTATVASRAQVLEVDQLARRRRVGPGEQPGRAASPPPVARARRSAACGPACSAATRAHSQRRREVGLGDRARGVEHPEVAEQLPAVAQRHAPALGHVDLGQRPACGPGPVASASPSRRHQRRGGRRRLALQDRAHPRRRRPRPARSTTAGRCRASSTSTAQPSARPGPRPAAARPPRRRPRSVAGFDNRRKRRRQIPRRPKPDSTGPSVGPPAAHAYRDSRSPMTAPAARTAAVPRRPDDAAVVRAGLARTRRAPPPRWPRCARPTRTSPTSSAARRCAPSGASRSSRRTSTRCSWARCTGPARARRSSAIDAALAAVAWWGRLPWEERVAPFLRAADMLEHGPWRERLNAATMLELSKTTYQADIDAACETLDFIRANVKNMLDMYGVQPTSRPGEWNSAEYRPLEGFVFAVTPFNFTCMNNLAFGPAVLGNTVVWKPAESASLVAHLSLQLLREAGLPDGVDQHRLRRRRRDRRRRAQRTAISPPCTSPARPARSSTSGAPSARTSPTTRTTRGSSARPAARTSSSPTRAPTSTRSPAACVRGAYEYQGQKCSAASRLYAPRSLWPALRDRLVALTETRRRRRPDRDRDLRRRGDQRQAARQARRRARPRPRRGPRRRRRQHRRLGRLVRRPDRARGGRPALAVHHPGTVRARAHRPTSTTTPTGTSTLRLVDESTPYGLTGAVFAGGRGRGPRRRTTPCATRPATSTSTTSPPARSSAPSPSAARERR